ncbi:MAG TPA: sialate O-acetylesterase, partial [Phycisphaerae bacterium]|nr:sialate O-acetylesterase [Phycisphaerae bacterium]
APHYTAGMNAFLRAMRRDLGDARLPVVAVQIGRVIGWDDKAACWNSIQDQQRRLGERIDRFAVIPAVDLELEDIIHISGSGQRVLGRRLAEAMHVLRRGPKAGKPPIAMRRTFLRPNLVNALGDVVVEYDHVVGELRAPHRPAGFTLTDSAPVNHVYRIDLEANRAVLRTDLSTFDLEDKCIHYGRGGDPHCNITDSAGRSLPAMGPIPIGRPRALTPFVQTLSVSRLLPSAGDLKSLKCPADLGRLGLRRQVFPTQFCNLHEELSASAPRDVLVYFACRVHCSRAMKLRAWVGYDGPVKLWVDGRGRLHDPKGTNPANSADAAVDFPAAAGPHTVLAALGSNRGLAWGIFLRFERMGVSLSALGKGLPPDQMPQVTPL